MLKENKNYLVLVLIFVFAFAYRLIVMLWAYYPPGADIGLHNSVIYSITQSGNTNFLWNFYQIGGGLSLTFPGYHIFAAAIMMMTGMPEYFVHAIIVALFSSLIVFVAYFITKTLWTESGAMIIALLVAISRFDIEMLLWGGYPNVITLLLIPLTFYLFLQRERFTLAPFLVTTSLLVGSIYLTHSLSAGVFLVISLVAIISAMIAPKIFGTTRKSMFMLLLPLFFGGLLVSPFLIHAIPDYLFANSGTFTGGVTAITQALLSTRILPIEIIIPLFLCTGLFFALSKEYQKKFITFPTFLVAMWLFVPLVLSQGYLYGFYIDYNRFLYFVILPIILLIGMFIDHGAKFFAHVVDNYKNLSSQFAHKTAQTANHLSSKISKHITRKAVYSSIILVSLLTCFFVFPIFLTPYNGNTIQSFYQVMNDPGYQTIQWAKQNTLSSSVFVSDALYGWWFGGFAQRPTLSAVDPQYLTLAREFQPSQFAKNILDTDYMLDNGYIQIREDGGYIGRHNPQFLADLNWTYFPYSFFQFNSSEITLLSTQNGQLDSNNITSIPVSSMSLVGANTNSPSIVVTKSDSNFTYTETLTLTKGVQFANMTIQVQSNNQNQSLYWLNLVLNSQGQVQPPVENTLAWLDVPNKEVGQLIFAEDQPQIQPLNTEYPAITQLSYNLQGKSQAEIQILVGLYPVTLDQVSSQSGINKVLLDHVQTAQTPLSNAPAMQTFDYLSEMEKYNVSYIANRDFELNPKFSDDPHFSLVFINNEVAVFKVNTGVK